MNMELQTSLDQRNGDSRVPCVCWRSWTLALSSDVEWLVSTGSFHKAACRFRVMIVSVLKACRLQIHPYEKIAVLQDLGFCFLSGFVGGIRLTGLSRSGGICSCFGCLGHGQWA